MAQRHSTYSRELDQLVVTVGEVPGDRGTFIRAWIWQYDTFAPKVRLTRVTKRSSGEEFTDQIKGLTADECLAMAPLVQAAGMMLQALVKGQGKAPAEPTPPLHVVAPQASPMVPQGSGKIVVDGYAIDPSKPIDLLDAVLDATETRGPSKAPPAPSANTQAGSPSGKRPRAKASPKISQDNNGGGDIEW